MTFLAIDDAKLVKERYRGFVAALFQLRDVLFCNCLRAVAFAISLALVATDGIHGGAVF